jgi:hypothetical protein
MSPRPPWVCEFVMCVSVQVGTPLSRSFVESRRMPFSISNLSPCVGTDVSLLEKSIREGKRPSCRL